MATIKEIKGNVRFAIDWVTEENYQPRLLSRQQRFLL